MADSEERWLPVVGFEGRYEVSDAGGVRSIWRRMPKTLSPSMSYDRPSVGLRAFAGAPRRHFSVYRLVLTAFVGPCPDGMEALHWNGRSADCTLLNLRWGTKLENAEDDRRNGIVRGAPSGEDHHAAKLWPEAVRVILAEPEGPGVIAMLARCFEVSLRQIRDIRARRYWAHISDPFAAAAV